MCVECVYSFTSHMMIMGGATTHTDLSIHVFDRVTVDFFVPPQQTVWLWEQFVKAQVELLMMEFCYVSQ